MSDNSIARIKIGDNIYTLQKMNPMDGMEYGTQVLSAISPAFGGLYEAVKDNGDYGKVFAEISKAIKGNDFSALLKTAYKQCFTPENESLADEVAFNRWFRKFPGDMYQLGVQAVYELVKDFFPNQLATIASAVQSKLKATALSTL